MAVVMMPSTWTAEAHARMRSDLTIYRLAVEGRMVDSVHMWRYRGICEGALWMMVDAGILFPAEFASYEAEFEAITAMHDELEGRTKH